jgi:hypothetical protein
MFGIGAIILTFRDTSVVLVSTCSRHNNELKNKHTAPGNISTDNGGSETKTTRLCKQRPTLIMIIAWEFHIISFILLMQMFRGYRFKDGREMDTSADNKGQRLIRVRMGNRKSEPTA